MHVPKPVLLSFLIGFALFIGWTVRSMTAEAAPRTFPIAATSGASPDLLRSAATDTTDDRLELQPIVVVVNDDGGAPQSAPPQVVTLPTPSPSTTAVDLGAVLTLVHELRARPYVPSAPTVVNGMSIVVNGDHIVIATDRSIVSVGDNTVVHGNTGDATNSGTISVDVTDSTVTSGDSAVSAGSAAEDLGPADDAPLACAADPVSQIATSSSMATADAASQTRAVGIAGWENRTIEVAGDENLVSSDGSHVFYEREGLLNSNTGDTRTSGLNVIDATGSLVRSGDSSVVADPSQSDGVAGAECAGTVAVTPSTSGSGASVAVIGSDNIAAAAGDDVLVIGGDGVLDRAVTIDGSGNVVTSEDASATVGGTGDVNAQGGDSETGGAVVMSVTDSVIEAGDALEVLSSTSATPT